VVISITPIESSIIRNFRNYDYGTNFADYFNEESYQELGERIQEKLSKFKI